MLKTKNLSVVVLVVALMAGFYMFGDAPKTDVNTESQNEKITILVEFNPTRRGPDEDTWVRVQVKVGGRPIINELVRKNPWPRVVDVPKGQDLEVLASQEYGDDVSCLIARGREPLGHDIHEGPGAAKCHYRLKG